MVTGSLAVLKQFDIEFQAPDPGKVVLPGIKKHAMKQRRRRIQSRGVARAQLAIDFDERLLRGFHRIALQSLADDRAHVIALG